MSALATGGLAPTPAREASSGPEHVPTPVDEYLRRQAEPTAVERFASRATHGDGPAGARWWQDRLPATGPGPGQQYGFRVDLDACTGCKACVTACHSLNGLLPEESWRTVGSLHGRGPAGPVVQTVTTACHHCVEPACLAGCPADAYEKDPVTGIVRHLDDACIGCSYCTLTCPYEVPAFDARLGIVRKCDMCAGRLAEGEAPACVQGCPTAAITIDVVDVAEARAWAGADGASRGGVDGAPAARGAPAAPPALVPGAPASALTVPATRYVSRRPLPPDLTAADRASVHPGHGHTPLAVMLVLTQASVGGFVLDAVLRAAGAATEATATAVVALATGLLALAASVLHLGRPLLAWRAVLGLRHSWLSREIVAFGGFAAAASASAAARAADVGPGGEAWAGAAVAVTGLVGVACSAQLYAATRRRWWAWSVTGPRFLATMGAGGAALVGTVVALAGIGGDPGPTARTVGALAAVSAGAVVVGVVVPLLATAPLASVGSRRRADGVHDATWRLLTGPLQGLVVARAVLAVVGGIGLPLLALGELRSAPSTPASAGVLLAAGAVATLGAELVERRLFFLASVAPRMPGMAR